MYSPVLEHVYDYSRALVELRRRTRRHVVLYPPNEPYFQNSNRFARWSGMCSEPGPVNYWIRRQFARLMKSHSRLLDHGPMHIGHQMVLVDLLPDN